MSFVLVFCAATVIASPAQTFTTLLNFDGADGSVPDYGSLIQGTDGNFYGTTSAGGANNSGTVFQLTPAGVLTTLYSFCSQQPNCADGADPYAGLVQASDGNFYGTTYAGGAGSCKSGCGTIFRISPPPQSELTTLYTFCTQTNCPDGANPTAGLIEVDQGPYKYLYGTTYAGGEGNCVVGGCGTIFSISLSGSLTTLKTFSNSQGAQVFAGLVEASDGNLYGTTEGGGAYSHGTVFRISQGGTWTPLYNFCSLNNCTDGGHPYAGLIQGNDGNLYGTTYYGGNNLGRCDGSTCGTVFSITLQGELTTLYSFCAQANCSDGEHPYAGLIQTTDGSFYGTTSEGGANGYGAVFKMTAGGSSLFVLHSFDNSDGEYPYGGLVQASNGNFYGTTTSGGVYADGTVFGLYQVNVTTWHNDNLRTGQNTNEIALTPDNLSTSNFGQLCSAALDGQVYAQPLVLSNVAFTNPQTGQLTQYSSLVYVVTQNNTLYVINGAAPASGNPCQVITSLSLNPAGQYPASCQYVGSDPCKTISPLIGALGTPVIQTTVPNSIGTLYVVTETQDVPLGGVPQNWYHYLHAVNLDQVKELISPVRVYPPILACLTCPQASYWSRHHIQRPGLLLVGNYLYIAFSMMDGLMPLPNGSVFRYNVASWSATPPLYFATTGGNGGGGVWQGGAGLAYGPDETGTNYIYFNTGNGNWDGDTNWADSFIKLDFNSLTVSSYFTPADQSYRNCSDPYTDMDFGSGGVMLTPASSYWPYLAVSGDKEGGIWLMDRLTPGGFMPGECTEPCTCSDQGNQNLETVWVTGPPGTKNVIHNTPAYWNNYVYIAPTSFPPASNPVSQYQIYNNMGPGNDPLSENAVYATGTNGSITTLCGATPSVSASPDSTGGIVWLTSGDCEAESKNEGGLIALDGVNMTELYVNIGPGSPCSQVDSIAPVTKFSVPTVANGYVYVGTQSPNTNQQNTGFGTFYIFGLNRQCTANPKSRQKSQPRLRPGLSGKASDL